MDDLKQSLKKVFEERIASPLFGYITLAWLGINWRPIAILIADKSAISERIKLIESTPEYAWQLWWPILVGALIACIAPYLHLLLKLIHHLASVLKDKSATNEIKRRYRNEMQLVRIKVQSAHAESLETARQKTREAIQDARTTRIEANTRKLLSDANEIRVESERIHAENQQILASRKTLESGLTAMFNELNNLVKSETAEEMQQVRSAALSGLEAIKNMPWPKQNLFMKFTSPDPSRGFMSEPVVVSVEKG